MIFFDVDGVLIHGYHARPELRQCWDENLPRDFGIDREIFKQNFIMGPFVTQVLVGQKDLAEALNDFFTAKNLSISADRLIDYWLK
ncbi:MAG: haloacid dehalogenase, partial [Alphaproteobacteria bacterium]|nr:haloacid dehalogenase [Alphaproteobacteria bacterium]